MHRRRTEPEPASGFWQHRDDAGAAGAPRRRDLNPIPNPNPNLSLTLALTSTLTLQALHVDAAAAGDAAAAAAPAALSPEQLPVPGAAPAGVHRRGFPYSPSGLQLNTANPATGGAGGAAGDSGCMAV